MCKVGRQYLNAQVHAGALPVSPTGPGRTFQKSRSVPLEEKEKETYIVEYAVKSPMEAVITPWQPRREFGAKLSSEMLPEQRSFDRSHQSICHSSSPPFRGCPSCSHHSRRQWRRRRRRRPNGLPTCSDTLYFYRSRSLPSFAIPPACYIDRQCGLWF